MNPIAKELNEKIEKGNPHLMEMLSEIGKNLFFPKGILTQSAEAKEKAHKLNATIGIAKEGNSAMALPSVMKYLADITPDKSLTYAPSFGLPELRKTWKEAQYQKNPSLAGNSISLPIAVNGITHAISVFADVWLDPGDVVILPDMFWGNYNMILNVRKHARLSHYQIFTADGGYNTEAFEARVREEAGQNKKITVLLNFPHNPTGYTLTEKEAGRIAQVLTDVAKSGTNVILVADDAYFGLFYEADALKESIFSRLCNAHPRLLAVKLDGATKENYVWGLRIGFMTYGCPINGDPAPVYDALERKTAGCVRGNISNACHLSQRLVYESMMSKSYMAEKEDKYKILESRAKKVKAVLKNPKYAEAWDVYPFNSGYFMCVRLKSVKSETLRKHVLEKYGVGVIALGDADIRVAFSSIEESDVQELFDILLQGVKDLR
ncbi:MAG: aminotransferase class I/II-fold pyridoxal phosphate-dependent enzyme [Desulfobacterales bacterium]|jgi:aspartate/methionine/tyrosine aminotransferase|nr:aminotransferase class I/II-fold pyridoxal phosphate-dependent enzyme [Desulfobacterales bacterium]